MQPSNKDVCQPYKQVIMRYSFFILLPAILISSSCKKASTPPLIPDGVYKGTFQRQTLTGGPMSTISITFSGNTWSGQGELEKYPALCNGTYLVTGADSIHVENSCAWTAEFDWSLILSHNYRINISGNNIELTRTYTSYRDIYKLTRQ
jgi:hypothetical protein